MAKRTPKPAKQFELPGLQARISLCLVCGKNFAQPKPSGRPLAFCSASCRVTQRVDQRTAWRRQLGEERAAERRCIACKVCGGSINAGHSGRRPTHCSVECRKVAGHQRSRKLAEPP